MRQERDDGSWLGLLIIFGIIIYMIVMILLYSVAIAFLTILILSGITGAALTIYDFVLALHDTIVAYRASSRVAPYRSRFSSFVYGWVAIAWNASLLCFRYNFARMLGFFSKTQGLGFLSFKKWLNIFIAISLLLFGTAAAAGVVALQLALAGAVFLLGISILMLLTGIFVLLGLIIGIGFSLTNYFGRIKGCYNKFVSRFSDYVTSVGFRKYKAICKNYNRFSVSRIQSSFSTSKTLPVLSFGKWFHWWNGVLLAVDFPLLLVALTPIYFAIMSVLFLVFKPCSLFKRKKKSTP